MSTYTVCDNRFKKDNKRISRKKVEEELNKLQLFKLLEKGKYSTRIRKPKEIKKEEIESNFTKKEISLINKYRSSYVVDKVNYKNQGILIDLMRKHNNYGYYNFVCRLDSDDEMTVNKAILKDIKSLKHK